MESQWSSAAEGSSGLGVTGYSPGDLPWRRPRRGMAVRGGRLELTISTTPNETLSMAVNMAQNGWGLGECLEYLGFLPPGHSARLTGTVSTERHPNLPARQRGEKKAPRSSGLSSGL
jgi:hypothetical protein